MIKEKLDQLPLSRTEVCEIIGISRSTLHNWENNEHVVAMLKYIYLLKVCDIDPFEILEEYVEKRSDVMEKFAIELKEIADQEKRKESEVRRIFNLDK